MNVPLTRLLVLAAAAGFADFTGLASAQLSAVAPGEPPCVFSGQIQNLSALIRNPGSHDFTGGLGTRLVQTTTATAAPYPEIPLAHLQVPAGETVLAAAPVAIPAVTAETRFLFEWLTGSNHIIGHTSVRAFPTNLLASLHPLAGEGPLGVFDPQNELKPLLAGLDLKFTDLEDSDLKYFNGRLAIFGPFASRDQERDGLAKEIQSLARRGTAVVWLQPPPPRWEKPQPSFYSVPESTNAVVIVQPEPVARLRDNPLAQQNLVWFCQLAEQPESVKFTAVASPP